jgi:hypothetical protein
MLVHPMNECVWTNHVLPFLCPSISIWRKHMPLILHEMKNVFGSCIHQTISCSSCRQKYTYRSFWLNDSVGVVVQANYDGNCYHSIKHVSDEGVLHCSTGVIHDRVGVYDQTTCISVERGSVRYRTFTEHNTYIYLERNFLRYYSKWAYDGGWRLISSGEIEGGCVCLQRALVLHSIRNRIDK